jgi:hypothetical protein
MFTSLKKFICVLIPISIILASCSHIPEITKPTNGDKSEWFAYYEDQFKAYGDDVEPPSSKAPEEQLQAYIEAKDSFEAAAATSLIISIVVLAIGVGSLIFTLGQL